jgi:addiction module RelE/StbE family toxin
MEIIWRPIAIEDLDHIRRFIAGDDPDAADFIHNTILNVVARLQHFPELGRPGRVEETREVVAHPYIIAYSVLNEQLTILAILHGAQRWPERF